MSKDFQGNVDDQYLKTIKKYFQPAKDLAYKRMAIKPGNKVCDMGCGIGVDLSKFSELAGPKGKVYGVDMNPEMIAHAKKLNLPNVEFIEGDIAQLPLDDASLDAVHYERVLQYVAKPNAAFAEAYRLLKKGGRLVMVESDKTAISFNCHHLDLMLKFRRAFMHLFVSPDIAMSAKGLLLSLNFQEVKVETFPIIFDDFEIIKYLAAFEATAKFGVEQGFLTEDEKDKLTQDLEAIDKEQHFFAWTGIFIVTAVK